MTVFSGISLFYQNLLQLLLFVMLLAELYLLIEKISHRAPGQLCLVSSIMLTLNFLLLLFLARERHDVPPSEIAGHIPWTVVAIVVLLSAEHIAIDFPMERSRAAATLSAASIVEATNDVPMGVCFSNPTGRIILCNNKLRVLANQLTGGYPQMMEELTRALDAPPETVTRLPDGKLRFSDGCVYNFQYIGLTVGGERGWHQLMAQNVTEQVEINEQLAREKESLQFKVYIHDSMGRSLLSIQDIMNSGEETEKKLKSLKEAVAVLSGSRPEFDDSIQKVIQSSAELGVRVLMSGYLPSRTRVEALTVQAVRECVTNCIRHAKGNEVRVDIKNYAQIYTVTISNNGEKPRSAVTEGSGLTGLRRSVEAAGGEMRISHSPAFALILNLPGKENEDYD